MRRRFCATTVAAALVMAAGCSTMRTTHTQRTAKEQLLISNSVDQALDKIDFTPFANQPVFLEDKYLDGTDKNYVVASLRHRLLHAGAALMPKMEEAGIVVEVRSGGIGTDNEETFLGSPKMDVPVPAMPLSVPEVKVVSRNTQTATAKIGLVAYDAKTKQILGSGGVTLARSDDNNWYVFGAGPYQHGSIYKEYEQGLVPAGKPGALPAQIAFEAPREPSKLQLASEADFAAPGSAKLPPVPVPEFSPEADPPPSP